MTTSNVNNGTSSTNINTESLAYKKYNITTTYNDTQDNYQTVTTNSQLNITRYTYTDPCTSTTDWSSTSSNLPPSIAVLGGQTCVKANNGAWDVQYNTYPVNLEEEYTIEFDYFIGLNSFASIIGLFNIDYNPEEYEQNYWINHSLTNTGSDQLIQVNHTNNYSGQPRTLINQWGHITYHINNGTSTVTYETNDGNTHTHTDYIMSGREDTEYVHIGMGSIMSDIPVGIKNIRITQL